MRASRAIAATAIVWLGCSGSGEAPVAATGPGGAAGSGGAGTGGAISAGGAGTGGIVNAGGAIGLGGSSGAGGAIAANGGGAGVTAAGGSGAAAGVDGGGGADASSAGAGGANGGGAGYACTPSGTTCHENGPNPSPIAPPNTPCCDAVCNHATNHCGCSAAGGPCSGLEFLYGPDCCPGLQCLDTGTAMICGVCHPDGAQCNAGGVCCSGKCNSITSTCGSSAVGGPCSDSRDCSGLAYCSNAHQCVIDVVCAGDGASCIAASECCAQLCNTVSKTCGCGYTGTGCTTNSDCCATASPPLCNSKGTCGCLVDSAACGVATDCCSGVCNGVSGKCGCSAMGVACAVVGDCCGGLTCGAAQKCCKASGQSCSLATDCCNGNCKGNGTCS